MKYTIATDGSYDFEPACYSAAVIRVEDTGEEYIHKAFTKDPRNLEARNVGGECMAVILALYNIGVLINENKDSEPEVTIIHDYNGVGFWAKGSWAARKDSSKLYLRLLRNILKYVNLKSLEFEWVRGHSNDRLNNMADYYCSKDRTGAECMDSFIKQLEVG